MKNGEHAIPDIAPQLDFRANPSESGQTDPADRAPGEIHADYRANPNDPPAFIQSPGVDHTIVAYDEPREPKEYNQMALGIATEHKGWSPDDLRTRLGSDI